MSYIARYRTVQHLVTALSKPNLTVRTMRTKKVIVGPLDNVDQRGNHLYRLLDKFDREVTMRVWQEVCKVVDVLNVDSPLERRELPVIFIKEMHYLPPKKRDYPERNIPPVIEPGTLMWWSIDDVFEKVINPGYALFATTENVEAYGNVILESGSDKNVTTTTSVEDESYNDPLLKDLLQKSQFVSNHPVSKKDILKYLRSQLNLFVPSEKSVVLNQMLSKSGEYVVPLKINSKHSENLRVLIS